MIKLPKEQEVQTVEKLQRYFVNHTEYEFTQFATLQLIDFLNEEIATYYYNMGIRDAEKFMMDKVADLVMLEK